MLTNNIDLANNDVSHNLPPLIKKIGSNFFIQAGRLTDIVQVYLSRIYTS